MDKIHRNERMSAMLKMLTDSPNRIITLSYFCERFGAAKSTVWLSLKKGHHGVALTDAELRLLACWIDLAVPFCGSYVEHHDWNDWYKQRFQYTCNKRAAFAWSELNDVRREYDMPPVPLTGFISTSGS